MKQYVMAALLFSVSIAAFSLSCSEYTFINHSGDDRYRYRLSYGDIPRDSPSIRLTAQAKDTLPARADTLILKKKSNDAELFRCYYVIENKNGPIYGHATFPSVGFSCPILKFDNCNVDIPG